MPTLSIELQLAQERAHSEWRQYLTRMATTRQAADKHFVAHPLRTRSPESKRLLSPPHVRISSGSSIQKGSNEAGYDEMHLDMKNTVKSCSEDATKVDANHTIVDTQNTTTRALEDHPEAEPAILTTVYRPKVV